VQNIAHGAEPDHEQAKAGLRVQSSILAELAELAALDDLQTRPYEEDSFFSRVGEFTRDCFSTCRPRSRPELG
jgi:hypothetical protein